MLCRSGTISVWSVRPKMCVLPQNLRADLCYHKGLWIGFQAERGRERRGQSSWYAVAHRCLCTELDNMHFHIPFNWMYSNMVTSKLNIQKTLSNHNYCIFLPSAKVKTCLLFRLRIFFLPGMLSVFKLLLRTQTNTALRPIRCFYKWRSWNEVVCLCV